MRPAHALAVVAALAGCAQGGLPVGPTVAVPAARFNDVQGEADLVVRAFVAGPEGEPREVGGAVCDVTSILFTAQLVTPARLAVPSFGPQSPTLGFACRAPGLTGRAEQAVLTRWVRYPGAFPGPGPWGWPYGYGGYGGPWGGYGGPWGGPWGGWGGPSYVTFAYPDVNVMLD